MKIRRDYYLNKLILKKHNGLIKVVTGIRRCGKSYLLFSLFKNHLLETGSDAGHIIEIAFDSFENKKCFLPIPKTQAYNQWFPSVSKYLPLLDQMRYLDTKYSDS